MRKRILALALAALAIHFQACDKEENPAPTPDPEASGELLRRLEWNAGGIPVADLTYSSDSLLQTIHYTSTTVSDLVTLTNVNKRVSSIYSPRLRRKAEYSYDNNNRVSSIVYSSELTPVRMILEFAYTSNDLVTQMQYFIEDASGKNLQYTNDYTYTSEGLISKILSTSSFNAKTIWLLEQYSAPCNVFPWAFIENVSVEPMYELYNYPVLSKLNRLPGKITKMQGATVESTHTFTYTIQNGRLDEVAGIVHHPGFPQYQFQHGTKHFY